MRTFGPTFSGICLILLLNFPIISVTNISVPKNGASCVLRHSKPVLCPKTTCSCREPGNPPKSDIPLYIF
ncbi:hypothetical protein ACFP3I_11845 [Chryseobacterium arachidis]|uniref:hypothetical protein n=1 Tax=Chryseobacterium arachidis TaxID=1416778 RepID=UPI00361F3D02